jgi:glycine hydroxymethyltransferase
VAEIGITVNRNAVPFDPRPPMVTSGLRIGTPALAARGFVAEDFGAVADLIAQCLIAAPDADTAKLARAVGDLAERYPLYPQLQPRKDVQ